MFNISICGIRHILLQILPFRCKIVSNEHNFEIEIEIYKVKDVI